MALQLIAAGSVSVNVQNDFGTHGVNAATNPSVGDMRATDQVFLMVAQGGRGAFPNGAGPVFLPSMEGKHAGGFDFAISAVPPNGWYVQAVNVDYLVVGNR
jgi:hypothetical protein